MRPFYYVITEFNDTINGRSRVTHNSRTSAICHFERTCSRCRAAVAIVEVKGPVFGDTRDTIAIRGRA